MAMRKQKLSPEASKAKAVRDKKIAMTPHRKKRKRDNERMGQRSDSDIHHPSGGGPAVRVSIKNNRGNFGKGTKIEGPNMMGQTWLNRRIKGPSAIGEMEEYKDDERRYARAERKISKAKEKSPEKGIKVEKKYGYNYDAAISAGLSPDSTGHWPSRDPATGMILKGRKHPTFYKTKAGEKAAGYKIYKKDGDIYSKPK